ncbi:MAG TPA: response regulator transcription factor [Thermoleophilaceae bacterium]
MYSATLAPGTSEDSIRRPIRVVIAEDAYLVREAVEMILAGAPSIEVVRTCEDGPSLLQAVEDQRPDAVVTDIRMPPSDDDEGIRIAHTLRETHPDLGVVVLSQYAEPSYPLALLEGGSSGRAYLLKESVHDRKQLVSAIEAVVDGHSVIDPKVVEVLVAARAREEASPLSDLTHREYEVLAEIAKGKSNAAIASSLFLTKRAVEKHINAIFMKLNLSNPDDVSRRVKATLMFLGAHEDGVGS